MGDGTGTVYQSTHRFECENLSCEGCAPLLSMDSQIANAEFRVVEAAVAANPELKSHWLRRDSRQASELVAAVDALLLLRERVEKHDVNS